MLFKNPNIESKALREWCKGRPCTLRLQGICQDNGRNTCGNHINSNWKGMGNKSPDIWIVIGCFACHRFIDEGWANSDMSEAERDAEILRALFETQGLFLQRQFISINTNQIQSL